MKHKVELLQQTPLFVISYFPQNQILELTWKKPPSQAEYKEGTEATLQLVRQHQAKKIISDNTNRGNPTPQDLFWLTHKVIPVLCEEHVQQLAIVVPRNPHHARSLECCLMTSDVCYDLQFFYSPKDAFDWLCQSSTQLGGKAVA